MPRNFNFENNRLLTHESAKAMVEGQHTASRMLEERSKAALKATGFNKMAALELMLANGGPFTAEVVAQPMKAAA